MEIFSFSVCAAILIAIVQWNIKRGMFPDQKCSGCEMTITRKNGVWTHIDGQVSKPFPWSTTGIMHRAMPSPGPIGNRTDMPADFGSYGSARSAGSGKTTIQVGGREIVVDESSLSEKEVWG